MFEYEIATARRADLIREADRYRMVREARRALKAGRAFGRSQDPEGPVSTRSRFTRAA